MRREVKITGNHMLDPTKTHNLMIYLFMDIKMHVSLRSFCEIVVKVKCRYILYMNARCNQTRAPSNGVCTVHRFNIPPFRHNAERELIVSTRTTSAQKPSNTHNNVLILIDDFNDTPEQHCYCYCGAKRIAVFISFIS